MERYRFDEHTRAAYEHSVMPVGIYQVVDGHVVTLIASDGLCELFGYGSRAEAMEKMDRDMYWNVHPDDVKRVTEAARDFILADKPYNLVCRVLRDGSYRLIHTSGKHITTQTGERLAVVWYIDEGSVILDEVVARDEEKIEKLKASMQSLLNNMPALSFSKDVETGIYLACNQAFAEYANRKTPEDVAGLTDEEIFDPVTAAHFVADDRKALTMDEPYVFFEDAPDAVYLGTQTAAFDNWIWPLVILTPALASLLYIIPLLFIRYTPEERRKVETELKRRREAVKENIGQ